MCLIFLFPRLPFLVSLSVSSFLFFAICFFGFAFFVVLLFVF